ncbi:MAG: nitronate monooxygenase family protein [Candidatus Zixiibacteriota bacterium]
MLSAKLSPLVIGNKIAPLPIVQGGMGVGISLSGLASAVANMGGVGVIAAAGIGMYESDFYTNYLQANTRALASEIRKAKLLTGGILGLNIMVAFSNYGDLVRTAVDEGIDIIFSGAGLPMNLPQYLDSNSTTRLVPIISSGRAAALICKRWLSKYDYLPDAVVVEGPRAGGHLGFSESQIFDPAFALERLVPEVVAEVRGFSERYGKPIPVIAAGGIYTGADIRAIMELGADGVQMGTRFVATHECDASLAFKQAYIDARPEDIVIIHSPVGMPGRAIRNAYLDDVSDGIKKPYSCPYHCIHTCDYKNSPYCIAHALISAKRGRFRSGFAFAGANVHRVTEIVSVKELVLSLIDEYEQAAFETTERPARRKVV